MCFQRQLTSGERYKNGMKYVEKKLDRAKKRKRSEIRVNCDNVDIHVIRSLQMEGYEIFFDWNRETYIIKI